MEDFAFSLGVVFERIFGLECALYLGDNLPIVSRVAETGQVFVTAEALEGASEFQLQLTAHCFDLMVEGMSGEQAKHALLSVSAEVAKSADHKGLVFTNKVAKQADAAAEEAEPAAEDEAPTAEQVQAADWKTLQGWYEAADNADEFKQFKAAKDIQGAKNAILSAMGLAVEEATGETPVSVDFGGGNVHQGTFVAVNADGSWKVRVGADCYDVAPESVKQ